MLQSQSASCLIPTITSLKTWIKMRSRCSENGWSVWFSVPIWPNICSISISSRTGASPRGSLLILETVICLLIRQTPRRPLIHNSSCLKWRYTHATCHMPLVALRQSKTGSGFYLRNFLTKATLRNQVVFQCRSCVTVISHRFLPISQGSWTSS